uniref:RagB/SusD family nutrient uptake outer membrane protein n=1 Tax=Prevotella sp. GTC17260 TaxID=3236796 RepID=A0AB33JLL7_9BACT
MKKIYINILLLAFAGVTTLSSCNDFLDVQPAGQLEQDVQFNDIRGFRDAMYGIYGKMASKELYGANLSYGFVDQLGQMFGYDNVESTSYYISRYSYTRDDVKTLINTVWGEQYATIADLNNILIHIDNAKFSHEELNYMKGECLGLRAFLHFDLSRLYCEDYAKSDATTRGLPYSTTFDLKNKTLYSLHDTYKQILKDLDEAEALLANDNTVEVEKTATSNYLAGRAVFFNKYAVLATKARVYYAMRNYEKAAEYAKKIVESDNFKLEKLTTMSDMRRFPANGEVIFGLYNTQLSNDISSIFLSQKARGNFMEGRRDLAELYESSKFTGTVFDIRYSGFYQMNASENTASFVRFIASDAEVTSSPLQGLTLIRLPEMYYILSESLYGSNPNEAKMYLNKVRESRHLDSVEDTKVADKVKFEQEMLRERMREMPGEGQVFYALKHYGRGFTDFRGMTNYDPATGIMVLPWPDRELEYGNK